MEIKIEGKWPLGFYLKRDKHNWVLSHRTPAGEKNKRGYCETQTFYPSIEQAVIAVMDRKAGNAETLQEVIDTVRDFKKHMAGMNIK